MENHEIMFEDITQNADCNFIIHSRALSRQKQFKSKAMNEVLVPPRKN